MANIKIFSLFLILELIIPVSGYLYASWEPPILVDSTIGFSRPQGIIVRNDSIYVAESEDRFIRSLNGGLTWQDRQAIQGETFPVSQEGFCLQGDTLAIFYDNVQNYFGQMLYYSPNYGITWSGPFYTPGFGPVSSAYPRHSLIYFTSWYSMGEAGIILFSYSPSFGGYWAYPDSIYYFDYPAYPQIYSFYDRIYLLTEVNWNGALYHSTIQLIFSSDSGNSWVIRDSLTDVGDDFEQHMAATDNGKMAFVYNDWPSEYPERLSHVYICFSSDSGSTWTWPYDLSNQRINYMPRMAISNDTVAVVWHGTAGPDSISSLLLRRSYDFGQTWDSVEVVGYNSGEGDVAINSGHIHVIYISTIDSVHGLYYRRWDPENQGINHHPIPYSFSLSQNYPNPFNASTLLSYRLDKAGTVNLSIYNLLGQKLAILADGVQDAGEHEITWNSADNSSGIYFARLVVAKNSKCIKLVVIK